MVATPFLRRHLGSIVRLRRAGFTEREIRNHGVRWMLRAIEEVDYLERLDQVRDILAGFHANVGQHVCDDHEESDVCCGNVAMRLVIEDLLVRPGQLAEVLPYDQDPNAKPDEAAIRAFFCPADPMQDRPDTFALLRVCSICGTTTGEHESSCPRAAIVRGGTHG